MEKKYTPKYIERYTDAIVEDIEVSPSGDLVVPARFIKLIKKGKRNELKVVYMGSGIQILTPAVYAFECAKELVSNEIEKNGLSEQEIRAIIAKRGGQQ